MFDDHRARFTVFTPALFMLALTACEATNADLGEDARREVELRGNATLILQPETSLDEDELEARNGYGATLTNDDGVAWFVRVEAVSDDELVTLDTLDLGDARVRLGELWDEEERGECVLFVPLAPGAHVVLSRPADAVACPTTADELTWIPVVEQTDDEAMVLRIAFGTSVGTFNGITAYSNGTTLYDSGTYSTCGLKWQCVEYVNRYYYQKLSHANLKGTGHAKDYYSSAAAKGLVAYANTNSTPPAVGDMLTSAGPVGSNGHIALVREVGANYVKVVHQNWANDATDNSKQLTMTVSGGKYTVAGFSNSYPVQGWLRRAPACSPSVNTVSPTTASLNMTTNFTVAGSCLPTTTTPWIANCANLAITSKSATQLTFSCKPSYSTGPMSGLIKHAPDGTTLKSFTLTVY